MSPNHRTGRPDSRGTYAFVDPRLETHAHVREWIEHFRKMGAKDPMERIKATNMIFRDLRSLAHQSDYFTKPINNRVRDIRARLKAIGIRVEEPIQDLKNGRELFARGKNYPLLLPVHGIGFSPLQNCRGALTQMMEMITRMHAAKIAHGHPHLNNFVVNRKGEVTMIDLSLAKIFPMLPKNKREFRVRFGEDLRRSGLAMAQLMYDVPGTKWHHVEVNMHHTAGIMVEKMLRLHEGLGVKTFGVTAEEILKEKR